jgi:hypothetical protein
MSSFWLELAKFYREMETNEIDFTKPEISTGNHDRFRGLGDTVFSRAGKSARIRHPDYHG